MSRTGFRGTGKRQSRGKCHRIQFFQKNIVARKGAKSLFATLRANLGSGSYYHHFNLLLARMTDPCRHEHCWISPNCSTIRSGSYLHMAATGILRSL